MRKRIIKLAVLFITIIISTLIGLYILDIIKFTCILRKLFNIYCVGCGTTRMIKALINLEIYQAFRYNPFMFILGVILIPYILYNIYLYIKKGKIVLPSLKIIIFIFILSFIYMILRNIPGFEYLLPIKLS